MDSKIIWKDENGGYILVAFDEKDTKQTIRLRRKYGWWGADKEISLPIRALEVLIREAKNHLDTRAVVASLVDCELFCRNEKGQIKRFFEDPLESLIV